MLKFLTLVSVLSLLTACATQSVIQTTPETDSSTSNSHAGTSQTTIGSATRPSTSIPTPSTPTPISIAAESLAQLARTQYQAGQYQSAIATAERGLRIDRRAASLYLVLAQSYVQLGLSDKARNFVQQGLRYSNAESDNEVQLLRLRDILNE